MALNPFLERKGFIEDPFASTNAGQEPRLAEYFVPPPYFHAVLGDPSTPQSNVVFAPRGGGKTAQRRMVEDFSVTNGRFLCVTYNQFELPSGFKLENADLAYHLAQISRSILLAILIELDETPELADRIRDQQKQLLKYLVKERLGSLSVAEFEGALKAIKSRGDRVREWLDKYKAVMTLISMVTTKLGLGAVQLAEGALELGTLDDSFRYQFGQLLALAQTVGYDSTYVLVDGVDELAMTSSDATAAYDFVRSLITDLQTLESPGGAVKFFMWDQMEETFRGGGARPDRIPQFSLRWSVDQLQQMMERRLSAFSESRVSSLNGLLCTDVTVNLHKLVAYMAEGSPRDMVRMSQRIVAEATRESADIDCIPEDAVWSGVRSFSRERAEELFGREYLDRLAKVGSVTFNISSLANDIFRVTENAVRSWVQKWQDTGQVAKVGEIQGKGRPQNVYGVTDLRLAVAILPDIDVPIILGNLAVACPTCGSIAISDAKDITCRECGSSFQLGAGTSLLMLCRR